MKIIHILKGDANPNTMNGVNKVVHHLATEQPRWGVKTEVWGIIAPPMERHHAHIYPLRVFRARRGRFILSKRLVNALFSLSPDSTIVHLHSVFLPELYAVGRILKKRKIPWVLSPHGGYALQSMKKNRLAKFVYMMLFEKRLIAGAMHMHVIGPSEITDLNRINKKSSKNILIPNGQDTAAVEYEPSPCIAPGEKPVFGFCGRLVTRHKGLDVLIRAFSRYKKAEGRGELWVIGDGPDKSSLYKLAEREGVLESIRFLGRMFGNKKLTHLARVDIFIYTSRWDGIPTAVLEAAALGKPLLISKATNLGLYVIKYGNGIVLRKNSPDIILKNLFDFFNLYRMQKLDQMGKKSIEMIENEFNWPRIACETVEKLYRN